MAGASSGLAGRASPLLWLVLLLLRGGRALQGHQGHQGHQGRSCRQDDVTFELITGFVYSAPKDVLDTRTGTLKLSDCIAACQEHANCQSLNFETGLCVLFSSSAETHPGGLTKSQFPVFTLFAQRTCLRGAASAGPATPAGAKTGAASASPRHWAFETVRGHALRTSVRRHHRVANRRDCMQLCLDQRDFVCRSANFHHDTGDCSMSDMDRFTVSGLSSLTPEERVDYLESNCVSDPIKMCDFTEQPGRILKTVDSVHQDVASLAECRRLCLHTTEFRCHSFDYEDTGPKVCRLSHHAAPSLQHIEEPYLELDKAVTYQLTACYNVTIDCRGTDMVARVQTNKVFNGKVYAKTRPNSCVSDVVNSLDFELKLGYHDLNCDVKQDAPGKFSADIIIQHHDQIVTGQDVGLSARCSYSLENSTVGHGVRLEVAGEPGGGGVGAGAGAAAGGGTVQPQETTYVVSPTVTMRITDRRGEDIHTAQVGDALSLRFYILDQHTPYQIFVRELIALDGVDSSEILLIDSLGCPTDPTIMGAISTVDTADGAQVLQAPFDAFKFPTSDVVQFKALVTPCLPKCEPVVCDVEDYYGTVRRVDSYGRRRREVTASSRPPGPPGLPGLARSKDTKQAKDEDVLLVQSIRIADKFQFDGDPGASPASGPASGPATGLGGSGPRHSLVRGGEDGAAVHARPSAHRQCVTASSLLLSAAVFLGLQVLLAAAWVYLWRPRAWSRSRSPWPHEEDVVAGGVVRRPSRGSAASSRASSCRSASTAATSARSVHSVHSVLAYHAHPPGQHWQRFYHAP